jgi:GR25 family glycosyltransferase involved in LPS biosynthesis
MYKKLYVLLFSLMAVNLFGAIQDHFKKAFNKSDIHRMRNIDFIYTINLDQRPEKFESCIKQLHPYGIYPYRFSAVNGWELSLETINDVGVKFQPWMKPGLKGSSYTIENGKLVSHHEIMHVVGKTYFAHCTARGPIGIVLSHLSVLQDAYDSNYDTIWVMEDDIEVIRDPRTLPDIIDRLDALVGKGNWDILFTDQDTKNKKGEYIPCLSYAVRPDFDPENPGRFAERQNINEEFRKIGARYGAYSMIIRRSGIKKILKHFKKYNMFLPYDLEFFLPNNIRLYTVIHDVVSTQINALSDNVGPRYKNKEKEHQSVN